MTAIVVDAVMAYQLTCQGEITDEQLYKALADAVAKKPDPRWEALMQLLPTFQFRSNRVSAISTERQIPSQPVSTESTKRTTPNRKAAKKIRR
jgi:hypothetical protein